MKIKWLRYVCSSLSKIPAWLAQRLFFGSLSFDLLA
jgi:hypothetical protein